MPCSSVVELIQLKMDANDRLAEYQFIKKTCGQGVGQNSLLIEVLKGLSVDELLEIDAHQFLHTLATDDEILEFLQLKHLFAVQATLEVLTGAQPGGRGSACAVADIYYDGNQMMIDAEIDVDIITEQIKSCSGCKGG